MVRVLQILKGLNPGGAESLLLGQAVSARRAGSSVLYEVAVLDGKYTSMRPRFEEEGVPVHVLGRNGGASLDWVRPCLKLLRASDFDIVHVHSPLPASVLRLLRAAGRLDRVPLIYTEHNEWRNYGRLTRAVNSATFHMQSDIICVSEAVREALSARHRSRALTVIHGIDVTSLRGRPRDRDATRRMLGVPARRPLVCTVANLRPEKGYDVLVHAAREVVDKHPQVLFVAVGWGPEAERVQSRIDVAGLGGSFRLLGRRDDAVDVMAASDAFVMASLGEGLPVAFMEAAALGLPSALTAVGGLAAHAQDGVSALLVPPGDPEALASAIAKLVTDVDLRRRLSAGMSLLAEQFDVDRSRQVLEARYAYWSRAQRP